MIAGTIKSMLLSEYDIFVCGRIIISLFGEFVNRKR